MSRILIAIISVLAVANLSACADIGKGKGKAPPPAAAAVYK
ncbi:MULTISPECIES: ABC transporter [unclassified Rhizobium]|nr:MULTISPECIES: ABC transporter [Rhizobium]MDK4740080.1 ABC transporter [Rhizobium sp. CNPSo 3464]UWU25098.1 ABC transporter [Rhizobium tropici]